MKKYFICICFLITTLALAQVRPTGLPGPLVAAERMEKFDKLIDNVRQSLAMKTVTCGAPAFKGKGLFDLSTHFQAMIWDEAVKVSKKIETHCPWTDDKSPHMYCVMTDKLSEDLRMLTDSEDFQGLAAHEYRMKYPNAKEDVVKREVESLHQFLKAINPKKNEG